MINELTSQTGVTASATQAVFTSAAGFATAINLDGSDAAHTVKINGQQLTVNLNGGSAAARRQQFISAVNTQVSGVTASAASEDHARRIKSHATSPRSPQGRPQEAPRVWLHHRPGGAESVVAQWRHPSAGGITATYATPAQLSAGGGVHSAANSALSLLDVSTVAGANTAMLVTDSILNTISSARGNLGAVQNRLASTVANLEVVSQKVSDAQSRIMNADFAAETPR